MALKQYKNVDSSPLPSQDDMWQGPWGKINPCEVQHIHFVRKNHGVEEVWTYPYEPLMRWVFKKLEPLQEIEILSGGDTILIRGYGLEKFLEPLEKRSLEKVEQQTMRFAAFEPTGCCVLEIKIEAAR